MKDKTIEFKYKLTSFIKSRKYFRKYKSALATDILSKEELDEIASQESYKCEWEDYTSGQNPPYYDEKSKVWYYKDWTKQMNSFYKHKFVEEYMSAKYDAVDWRFVTNNYNLPIIREIIQLYLQPLAWTETDDLPDGYAVVGKVARSMPVGPYNDDREFGAYEWYTAIKNESVLYFADTMPCYEKDNFKGGYKADMHRWEYLITINDDSMADYLKSNTKGFSSFNNGLLFFDIECFRANIRYIIQQRGVERAAEIVTMFQKEWEDIEQWEAFEIAKYPKDQIRKFKLFLFHGLDKELKINLETPKVTMASDKPKNNRSICSSMEFEQLLQCEKREKGRVMKRLHELLDGKGGKEVAIVLAAAMYKYNYLLHIPTEKQYTAGFELTGTWKAVRSYIKSHTDGRGVYQESLEHVVI